MGGAADKSEESQLDAAQQILAAYGAVMAILLDLLLEKSVIDLAELRPRLEALLRGAQALQPHGARAIQSQLAALMKSASLGSAPPSGSQAQ